MQVAVQIAIEGIADGGPLAPSYANADGDLRGEGQEAAAKEEEAAMATGGHARSLGVGELGDCPYGKTSVQRDSNGKLLRRGDHICRQGKGLRTQHAIYVGEDDIRAVIYFKPIAMAKARGAPMSMLAFGGFDEFRQDGEVRARGEGEG